MSTHTHSHARSRITTTHQTQHNWPLLRVSKGYFDGPAATEDESHAALDGDIGGGWGGDDLDLGDDGEAKETGGVEGMEDGDEGAAEGDGGGGENIRTYVFMCVYACMHAYVRPS